MASEQPFAEPLVEEQLMEEVQAELEKLQNADESSPSVSRKGSSNMKLSIALIAGLLALAAATVGGLAYKGVIFPPKAGEATAPPAEAPASLPQPPAAEGGDALQAPPPFHPDEVDASKN
ncbi:hypothetical protein Emed_002640 [Eimeria media]